jgi:hypothetical protein
MSGALPVEFWAAFSVLIVSASLLWVWPLLIKWFFVLRARAKRSASTSSMPTVLPSNAAPTSPYLSEPESAKPLSPPAASPAPLPEPTAVLPRHKGITVKLEHAKVEPHIRAQIALVKEIVHKITSTRVMALKCPLCGCTIFSRYVHDFRSCSCGAVHIDGGFDYTKVAWDDKRVGPLKPFEVYIDATKRQLYDDWNNNGSKYGLIKPKDESRAATSPGADRPRSRRAHSADRKSTAPRRPVVRRRA